MSEPLPPSPAPDGAAPVEFRLGAPSPLEQPAGYDPFTFRYWLGRMDLRPLALFRWAFGFYILYDLCDLVPDARTWFSNEGVLPLATLLSSWARTDRFSLLDTFGSTPLLVGIYFALAFAIVVCFTVGYRTRLMSVLTFIFMASIQERCPPLFDGSDDVMRLMCAWNMFTPCGNVWSVDALLAERKGKPLAKEGCALFIRLLQLQVAWIYFDTGLRKMVGETWRNGTALHFGLHLTHVFGRPWATQLADLPVLVMAMTWFTVFMELSYPVWANLPSVTLLRLGSALVPPVSRNRDRWMPGAIQLQKYGRVVAIGLSLTLHLGITLTINVGHFDYLMPTVQLLFLEPEWAEALWLRILKFLGPRRVEAYRMLGLRFPAPDLGEQPTRGPLSPGFIARVQRWGSVGVVGMFVLCMWYSAPDYVRPPLQPWAKDLVDSLDIWASWDMFSPNPLSNDYHLTAPAEYEDGSRGNLFGGAPDGPGEVRGEWDNRWWKYWETLGAGTAPLPLEWGRYVCREHNFNLKPGQPRLYNFTLYQDNQLVPPFGQPWPPVVRNTSWNHYCYDKTPPPVAHE